MSTVRRLYLYGVSAIALWLVCLGVFQLLRLALEQVAGAVPLGAGFDRESLAVALALVLVGLPLWLLHWWLVERSVRRATPEGDADRRSVMRAFYLAVVAAVAVAVLSVQATTLLEQAIRLPLGVSDPYGAPMSDGLALALVAFTAWAFHIRTRHLDTRAGPLTGAAAWVSRLYLYGAMLAGAIVGLRGISQLIETVGNEILGTGATLENGFTWSLANAIALTAVGGAVYAGHSVYARRLTVAGDWRSEAERASQVRAVHDVVALAIMAFISLSAAAEALRWILAIPLGVGETDDLARLAQLTVGPIAAMLPFLVGGVFCGRMAVRDAERFVGLEAEVDTQRQTRLVLASLGLAFAAVGSAGAFGIGLEQVLGPGDLVRDVPLKEQLALFGALAIVGLPVWLVAWMRVQRSGAAVPAAESRSTARRGHLFLVIGASVIAAGLALAFILYEAIRTALGIGVVRLGADLSQPIAIVVVGIVLVAYHGWVLRGDLAVRAALEPAAVVVPPVPGLEASVDTPGPTVREELVLEGPPGADLETINQVLREHLPSGWSLRVVSAGAAHGRQPAASDADRLSTGRCDR